MTCSERSSVLVVCLGNTCRSPMAAAIAGRLLGPDIQVESAGIETADGLPATKHAVTAMLEQGLDISGHHSRDIEALDIGSFSRVIAMTPSVARQLIGRGVSQNDILTLDVPDPYCKGLDAYRSTAKAIEAQLGSVFGKAK